MSHQPTAISHPRGMSRRHFLSHLATSSLMAPAAAHFLSNLQTHAAEIQKNRKACILVWLQGGAPTIDMWDLKPDAKTGGEFNPIATAGDMQICEHLPETAKVMDSLSLVRSMSTREADHERGRYYMHTAFVPNPTVVHPTFGSVVSYELSPQRPELEIPAFISIGGGSFGPGFLGMAHAPFVVSGDGQIRNAELAGMDPRRLNQRLQALSVVEETFINSDRGELPVAHKDVYGKAVNLMTSQQMRAFKADEESQQTRDLYGSTDFGISLIMARRLVETGVPFVEVQFPGSWDLHNDVFNSLRDVGLPKLDKGLAGLTRDLKERGLWDDTVIVCMGEFGRTPRINQNVGRDHWARSWSVCLGGGGLTGGIAVGETNEDGTQIIGKSYLPGDLWATVAHALRIPLDRVHKSKRGRPMKLAGGGTPIAELIG
ncbi:MAG: DUF1501 domain-containing protein [Planctomycetaceae bacterium]|nr:DUF1501 domain-containing protein [Planctomycetaceae bacterium]